jgi:integrase
MATIIKRINGWRAQIRKRGYQPVSLTFDTKRDAEIWAAEVEAKMHRDQWHDADESTTTKLSEALQRYLLEVTPTKKGAKQEANRIKAMMKLPLADWYLAEIRGKQMAEYRDARLKAGKSPSTIRNELTIISQVYQTAAKEWGMYELRNPVDNVKRPKQKRARERRLKHNEQERLMKVLASPYSDAVLLLLETALRRSELCRLQWQDLNLYKRTALIRDTKNGEDRIIPLSPLAVQVIVRQPQTHESVFKFSPDMLTQAFRAATRQAGIRNLRLHDLRKEATSRLVESKCFELPEIMRMTGHKTLTAFNVYMHIKAEELAHRMANMSEN